MPAPRKSESPEPESVADLIYLLQAHRQEIAALDEDIHKLRQRRQELIDASEVLVERIQAMQ